MGMDWQKEFFAHKEFLRLKDENERLLEAIQKWYDYGYNRGEAEKLLEALREVRSMIEDHMHLDHADDALEIIDKALEGK
jgi:hypothetical protein